MKVLVPSMQHVKVKTPYLLHIAGFIWLIAGFNIARLGILAYLGYLNTSYGTLILAGLIVGSLIIYGLFNFIIFRKLVFKHRDRVRAIPDERSAVWAFFDKQSYIMMILMMTLGISLRSFHLVPSWFIAFFYTGLGIALMWAGAKFFMNGVRYNHDLKAE